jgi:acid phosphatase family membrane protein YuiD
VASVTADFAEADLAVLVFMGHMPTADTAILTAILTAMAATTTTAAAIWFVSA